MRLIPHVAVYAANGANGTEYIVKILIIKFKPSLERHRKNAVFCWPITAISEIQKIVFGLQRTRVIWEHVK